MGKYILAILMAFSAVCVHAALVIDYTGNDKSKNAVPADGNNPIKPKNLLLDNSVNWATFVESDKCLDKVVSGTGNNISLSMALRMLTPDGWKVYADDGVILDQVYVSWRSGALWTKIISDSAELNKFQVVFNCLTKELTIKNAPELGSLSSETKISEADIGDLSQASVQLAPSESTTLERSKEVVTASPTKALTAQENRSEFNTKIIEPVPYANESVSSYLDRYARHYDFNRVAYRLNKTNQDLLLRSIMSDSKAKSLADVLRVHNLIQLNGTDIITNDQVMVISDDLEVTGSTNIRVFPVATGMLSKNATDLAAAVGYSIGENNQWPKERLESDYKVPFSYDIVLTEAIDGFSQLFSNYPLQARFIMGTKSIFVVKRNSANRHSK